jgi:choline dehydrogenase-like flavoprotein
MLVTTIPAALERGATLFVQTRAERLLSRATGSRRCTACRWRSTAHPRVPATLVSARHFVVSGGAINSPALLLRSKLPDPRARPAHLPAPVVISAALFERAVEGWHGAPQTVYSDHFLETQPSTARSATSSRRRRCTR